MYTNARSMGKKQDMLEIIAYGETVISLVLQSWWDNSYNWNINIKGYTLFQKNRVGRKGGAIVLNIRNIHACSLFQEEEYSRSEYN